MSLVDYASSDEEDFPSSKNADQPQAIPPSQPWSLSKDNLPVLPPPTEKLPDASFLLSSPTLSHPVGGDHSSRVVAAMAENASRKREANGSSSSYIRGKIPRGNLRHTKDILDTNSGLLVPPQLSGRSNVVTEDIKKLFVKKKSPGET